MSPPTYASCRDTVFQADLKLLVPGVPFSDVLSGESADGQGSGGVVRGRGGKTPRQPRRTIMDLQGWGRPGEIPVCLVLLR